MHRRPKQRPHTKAQFTPAVERAEACARSIRRGLTTLFLTWTREALARPWPKSEKRIPSIKGNFFLQKGGSYRFHGRVYQNHTALTNNGRKAVESSNMLLLNDPIWALPVSNMDELVERMTHNMWWSAQRKDVRPSSGFYRLHCDQLLCLGGPVKTSGGRTILNMSSKIRSFMEDILSDKHKPYDQLTPEMQPSNAYDPVDLGFKVEPNGTIRFMGVPTELSPVATRLRDFITMVALSGRKSYYVDFLVDGKVTRYYLSSEVDPATIFERTL